MFQSLKGIIQISSALFDKQFNKEAEAEISAY
jgi:hypothetical protein